MNKNIELYSNPDILFLKKPKNYLVMILNYIYQAEKIKNI